MRILGIDPGTATIGFGVLDVSGPEQYVLIDYGLVETDKSLPHGQRLDLIFDGITKLITRHSPDIISIERLFFATNALTAIAVGQAIGVIKLAIHRQNLDAIDYTPMQVKLQVGGDGRADKKVMKEMIKTMFNIQVEKGKKSHFDDTADAIALAVCHARKTLNPVQPSTKKTTRPKKVK